MQPEPGMRIGKYELGPPLGEGAFGILYCARDTELGREIAIKILRREHNAREQYVQRFLQEARAAARIAHPGIITVYDSGQHDGMVYIAMELLTGVTLFDRMKDVGRIPIAGAIELCRQMAAALSAAHTAGIVHRDLKPQNIFLVPDPSVAGDERVKILDFGIAKLFEGAIVETSPTVMLGPPLYMSPEQCKGKRVDGRSDIYALGCLLFHMLIGRTPFEGASHELVRMHELVDPPTVRSLAPEVPAVLDDLVTNMMAKSPDDRPTTMAAVLDELSEWESTGDSKVATVAVDAGSLAQDTGATVIDLKSPLHTPAVAETLPAAPPTTVTPRWRTYQRGLIISGALGAIAFVVIVGIVSKSDDPPPAAAAPPGDAAPERPDDHDEADRIALECLNFVTAKKWSDASACADRLAVFDADKAAVLASMAKQEATKLEGIERADSPSRPPDKPTRPHKPARPATADPIKAACDAKKLKERGIANASEGHHAAALAALEASFRCKFDRSIFSLAFVSACKSNNTAKAKHYFVKLFPTEQSKLEPTCRQLGIDVR